MSDFTVAIRYVNVAKKYEDCKKYSEAFQCYKMALEEYYRQIMKMDYRNPMCKHYREEINRLLDHTEAIKKKYIDKQPTNSTSLSRSSSHNNSKTKQGKASSYEQIILNEVLDSSPNIKWDDVCGMNYAKQVLMETVILPAKRPDIFTGLRAPPMGILLFGPPGTGKTLLAKAVASESKATFFSISASSLTSKYVGESEKMVRALFEVANKKAPSVVFIDEIDSLLSKRSENEHESSRRIKTEFLVRMEGVEGKNERVLIIGATNRPFELDDAVLRRIPKKIYVSLPDEEGRILMIQNCLKKEKHTLSANDIKTIAKKSEGYSGSDMTQLCKEAMMNTIRGIQSIEKVPLESIRPANLNDFMEAFNVIKASVPKESLAQFEIWNAKYGATLDK